VDDLVTANGTERLLLHNNLQDPSAVRQCLAYDVFRAAGHEAPRCNLAHVTVNGEDLGVYTHVEAVRSDYLRRHHASDEGDLYEGALSDFLDGWMATFDPKTNDTDPTLGPRRGTWPTRSRCRTASCSGPSSGRSTWTASCGSGPSKG
jgi:hypothetical protein